MGTKSFVSLLVGVPITKRMDLNAGNIFLRGLCTLDDR